MPAPGFTVISIHTTTDTWARAMYARQRRSGHLDLTISYSRWMNNLLEELVLADEAGDVMQLKLIVHDPKYVLMLDRLPAPREVEVRLVEKSLRCISCNRTDCIHVGFASYYVGVPK